MKYANGFAFRTLVIFLSSMAQAATDINWVKNELDSKQFTSIEAFLADLPQIIAVNTL